MAYMWNEFNIKRFSAETIVYRNGVFCPDLSTIPDGKITKKYDLPVHVIYVGEISGKNILDIDVSVQNQPVFLSVDIKNEMPAFFSIFIKNTGKNSEIRGHVVMENKSDLQYECVAWHGCENTGILVKNKLIGRKNSNSVLYGVADIDENCPNCNSDIGFSAILEHGAKTRFLPAQKIHSVPHIAEHSASIFNFSAPQILYLRQSGLGILEIQDVMAQTFKSDNDLF